MKSLLPISTLLLAACSGASLPALPDGVVCAGTVHSVTDDAELQSALSQLTAGECVILAAGQYTAEVVITAPDVWVSAELNAEVTITAFANAAQIVAIRAPRVGLAHLRLSGGIGHGVLVQDEGARLLEVTITDVRGAAVGIRCEDDGCLRGTGGAVLTNPVLERGAYGLLVDHSAVRVEGGRIEGFNTSGVSGGAGVYAVNGAQLQMQGSAVLGNLYGIVADGADTQVQLQDCLIQNNREFGVWGQGLRGTMSAPALVVSGSNSRIDGNGIVGLGAFDARGISLQAGVISNTVARPVQIDPITTVEIGDGVAFFSDTQAVNINGVNLSNNARAQALLDGVGANIVLGPAVQASGGQYNVVVQNTNAAVMVPSALISVPMSPLAVRPAGLQVPGL